MDRGWIKLYRKIEDSPIFADDHLFKLFVWLLLRVTRKPFSLPVKTGRGETIVTLQPGQALVGRNALAKAMNWRQSTARNRLLKLSQILDQDLDIQPNGHFSIVTLRNYEIYQGCLDDERTGKRTGKRTTKGQAKDTNKNYKNEKNTSITDAGASEPAEGGNGKQPPGKRKHPAYTMSPEEYAVFVNKGIARLQAKRVKLEEWGGLYPLVNVDDAIMDAAGWLLDRTDTGEKDRRPKLEAFVGNWLRKAHRDERLRHGN